jgi:hypothetical protein
MISSSYNFKDFSTLLRVKFSGFTLDKLNEHLERLMVYKRIFDTISPKALAKNGFNASIIPLCLTALNDIVFKVMTLKSSLLELEQLPGQVSLFGLGKVFDTARQTGINKQDGITYIRQAPLKNIHLGNYIQVSFALNKEIEARTVIIEADELQPSHIGAVQNPLHFIPEAQPRNRATSHSGSTTPKIIAEHLRPAEICEGATAYTGTPVINERGEVIPGNGRAYTLKLYYSLFPNDPKGYKRYLHNQSKCLGFIAWRIEKEFKKPVMARMVTVSDYEAIELGQYTQKDLEAVAGETTQIKSKVGLVSDESLDNILNELLRNDNGEKTLAELIRESQVLKQLIKENILRKDELEIYTRSGVINETGTNFVTKFLLNLIFKDGDVNTPDVFTQLPVSLQKAIEKSSLYILKVRGSQNINTEISKAILGLREYLSFKSNGSLEEWKKQADIFGGTPEEKFSELELKLIGLFADSTTQKQIIEPFKQYAFWATLQPGNMFEPERPALSKTEAVFKVFHVQQSNISSDIHLALQAKQLLLKLRQKKA